MVHRRIGDTRNRPKHTTPPQTKKRTLVAQAVTYDGASDAVLQLDENFETLQIRKNKHGFGIYSRAQV